MTTYISLAEAASLLGVSKETLRNWDRAGKLPSHRGPNNNYRTYDLEDVQRVRSAVAETSGIDYAPRESTAGAPEPSRRGDRASDAQERDLKRALARVHRALRDTDGNSSIVERFDEATKLLFLKLLSERDEKRSATFLRRPQELDRAYAERLQRTFQQTAARRPNLFPEKFRQLRLSPEALSAVGEILATVELAASAQDVKGYAYEEMIRNTFDKGDNQQFFTPHPIAEFLVALMGERLAGAVCDPAAGTGGFLVELVKQRRPVKRVVALEIDERLTWVAGMNLFVHGAEASEAIFLGNGGTLGKAGKRFHGAFDAIVTNPPFGSDFSDGAELAAYTLGKGKTSRRRGILFIERCLELLKDGGWLGIVIDEGVLSLATAEDVRDLILQRSELAAVISLPETAFMPYASVNTSILVLRKNARPSPTQITFYARAENIGRKPNGDADVIYDESGAPRLNSDLPTILQAWRAFQSAGKLERQTELVFLANPLASANKLSREGNRLDFQFHHPSRIAAHAALEKCPHKLGLLADICEIRNEGYVPSVDFPDQLILYTGLAHIDPRTGHARQVSTPANALTSGVKKYYRGDILFARMRPNLRKAVYIDFDRPGFASAECVVLRVKKSRSGVSLVDPFLLATLLRSDYTYGQIIHLIAGIGRPRIALKDLLSVRIPLPPREQQEVLRDAFIKTMATYESLRFEARSLLQSASSMELQAIESLAQGFIRTE